MIVEATGNRLLLQMFEELSAELRIVMRLMGYETAVWESLPDQHIDVLEAISSGDARKAEIVIEVHSYIGWSEALTKLRNRTDLPLVTLINGRD